MRSVSFSALRVRELDNPRTKRIPSIILDFPLPLGPEIVVKSSKKGIFTFFPNDLKFRNSIFLIYTPILFGL
jgi:hypothetical protein